MGWVWVLIPLAALSIPIIAILSSVIEKYLKAQEKQASLLTEEFIEEMRVLKESFAVQQKAYEQRIANLEAIVSAQAWEALPKRQPASTDKALLMPDLETYAGDLSPSSKTALLARTLK